MSEYEEAARRGAALLDERVPDWREYVDTDKLHLGSECGCVLGQIFGSWHDGVRKLGLSDYGEYGGFYLPKGGAHQYGWLTRAWHKVLRNG